MAYSLKSSSVNQRWQGPNREVFGGDRDKFPKTWKFPKKEEKDSEKAAKAVVRKMEDENISVRDYDFNRKSHRMLYDFIKTSKKKKEPSRRHKRQVVRTASSNPSIRPNRNFTTLNSFSVKKPIQLRNSASHLDILADEESEKPDEPDEKLEKEPKMPRESEVTTKEATEAPMEAETKVPKPLQMMKPMHQHPTGYFDNRMASQTFGGHPMLGQGQHQWPYMHLNQPSQANGRYSAALFRNLTDDQFPNHQMPVASHQWHQQSPQQLQPPTLRRRVESPNRHTQTLAQRPLSPEKRVGQRPFSPGRRMGQRPFSPERRMGQRPFSPERRMDQRPFSPERRMGQRPFSPERRMGQRPFSPERRIRQRPGMMMRRSSVMSSNEKAKNKSTRLMMTVLSVLVFAILACKVYILNFESNERYYVSSRPSGQMDVPQFQRSLGPVIPANNPAPLKKGPLHGLTSAWQSFLNP